MKRLVVCFDGTWNNADNPGADTNVARIAPAICPRDNDGVPQIVLYLRGVGTTGLHAEKIFSGATGLGVDDNIRSAYMFLAQNYEEGDQIFLFGFSRGSFSARSLVGLISGSGLLRRSSLGLLGEAWAYYRTKKPHSPDQFAANRPGTRHHQGVRIDFLGVWDTVGSMGIPGGIFADVNRDLYGFYDTGPCSIMRRACHAMAIDEHRDTFVPTFWTGKAPDGVSIDQVWFAGVHSDVGGGYLSRDLADIPLVWMAKQAQAAGLQADSSALPDETKLDPLAMQHDSSHGLFALNRLVPTYRELCGMSFDVPLYQRLYQPVDTDGKLIATVREAVHQSVIDRYGKDAGWCEDDEKGFANPSRYAPPNAAALFTRDGTLKEGVRVEPY